MNLDIKASSFRKATQVEIPDIFYKRFKTGMEDLDLAFGGEGFLPGMSFTLAGTPGCGKTTMLLQTLELLEKAGKKTAYISAEETIYQLAFTSKRLNLTNVCVANMNIIEDIFDEVEANKFDIVILDSLPSLRSRRDLSKMALEAYLSNYITSKAKELNVVVGVILHCTKTGNYKGSTLFPHSVDANIMMRRSADNEDWREVESTKNRFGQTGIVVFPMTPNGFDFQKVEPEEEEVSPKKSKTALLGERIIDFVEEHQSINPTQAAEILGDVGLVQRIMKDLVNAGILQREGRGTDTVWVIE
jgi:DNA repair protein RadA/Sms